MNLLIAMLMVEPTRRTQDVGQLLEFEFLRNDENESMNPNDIMKQAVDQLQLDCQNLDIKQED